MLPRPLRVVNPAEHRELARRGTRVGTSTLVLHLAASRARPDTEGAAGQDGPGDPDGVAAAARAGVVVGKPVGDAVTRHRVARRLRHVLAARLPALKPGTALVVRARPAAAGATSARLGADLDTALARAARSRRDRVVRP